MPARAHRAHGGAVVLVGPAVAVERPQVQDAGERRSRTASSGRGQLSERHARPLAERASRAAAAERRAVAEVAVDHAAAAAARELAVRPRHWLRSGPESRPGFAHAGALSALRAGSHRPSDAQRSPLAIPRRARTGPTPVAPQIDDRRARVYNEEAALELSVRRLHRFLTAEFPFSWRIVIADNASTDATPAIAARARRASCPASTACGSSARAAAARCAPRGRRSDARRRLLHGRRPLDRPARAAAARRAAALRPQRRRDRHAARARRARRARARSAS